jgi:uncharacterized protein with FMN-binding domain
MRRITIGLLMTVSVLVLLFSYHTSTSSARVAASSLSGAKAVIVPARGAGPPAPTTSTPSGSAPSTTRPTNVAQTVVDGASVETGRGPVQVRVTFQGDKILEVDAVVLPSGSRHDRAINDAAVPILHSEVLQAQSANVDMVSGATLTSEGYLSSLQSAIDLHRNGN